LRAAEEQLAQMAETGEHPGLMKRIYAVIRAALKEMGFKLKLTDADIQRMLTRTREWVESGRTGKGVAETQPLSALGGESPDILFSLSTREMLDRLQTKLQGTPNTTLDVIFGKERDLGELAASFGIPAWLGKTNATVKEFHEREDQRAKDRSKTIHDYLQETSKVYDLFKEDQLKFDELAFELDGNKVVDPKKFKRTGTRQLIKGPQQEIVDVPVYELNDDHYRALGDYLREEKQVSDSLREAYLSARRALDRSLIQTYERLQEIKGLDPTLIEEYRNEMGTIHNYWPHVREGSWHIRVIDPKAGPEEEAVK
jgi:hypothetical protein